VTHTHTHLQGVTNFDVQRIAEIVEKGGVKVEANQVNQKPRVK